MYDAAKGRFYLERENGRGKERKPLGTGFRFGPKKQQWLPLAGDWNGDSVDTIELYDPITGKFHLGNRNDKGPPEISFRFGEANAGWVPLSGDWNADGRDGVGLFEPGRKTYHLRNELTRVLPTGAIESEVCGAA